MGQAIGEVLPFAAGVAISPVPIIAVILVLFSARARVNGPAFLLGWVLGVGIVSVVVYLVANAGDTSDADSGASDTSYWIKLVLGVLLVMLAVRNWRTQSDDTEKKPPKWMASIDSLSPAKATGLALLLKRGESEEPGAVVRRRQQPRPGRRVRAGGGRGAHRLRRRGQPQHRRTRGPLPRWRPAPAADVLDGWKTWLSSSQRRGDGGALPGVRCRALQPGPARPLRMSSCRGTQWARMMQRKPMCDVDVSIVSAWRAAGR